MTSHQLRSLHQLGNLRLAEVSVESRKGANFGAELHRRIFGGRSYLATMRPANETSTTQKRTVLIVGLLSAEDKLPLAAKAPATRRAYRSDFEIFRTWCDEKGTSPLPCPPETVAAFLACEAGSRSSPPLWHGGWPQSAKGIGSPAIPPLRRQRRSRSRYAGINRTLRAAPKRKAPATADKIVARATSA
jgi:hypothetical protein